jgi:hypothetical protein
MSRWTDEFLSAKRQRMDPLADETVKELFEKHGLAVVRSFHGDLVDDQGNPKAGLPDAMVRYLNETSKPPEWLDPAKVALGEEILQSHGILIFILLACASLPECYVDRLGMPVLFLTQKLNNKDISRRVVETSKYVVDVLSKDGFKPTGRGLDSTRKVRLMHAATRYLILHTDEKQLAAGLPPSVVEGLKGLNWKEELGLPVNQEDLAYTLQTFAWVSIRGMRDLKAKLEPREEEAIIHCWNVAGHYLGIDGDLLPESVDEAEELFKAIKARVAGESVEGKSLTAAIIEFAEQNIKLEHFEAAPRVLTRYLVGDETADMLGLPRPGLKERFDMKRWVLELSVIVHLREKRLDHFPEMRRRAAKRFGRLGGVITEIGATKDDRVPFEIPTNLADHWSINELDSVD